MTKALVARYQIKSEVGKPYFWPVAAPGGAHVTRDWPMQEAPAGGSKDHPHQRSLWYWHGDVIPEGIALTEKIKNVDGVDFWSVAKGSGRIACTSVEAPKIDGKKGSIKTHNEWRTASGKKVLDEKRTITLHDLDGAWLIVLDTELHASVAPITFGDTKEGAMGVRVADAICEKGGNGKIQNAEGKVGEKECWGQKSAWCDYSGKIGGKAVGITLMDDPKNPHPSCWHVRGYGLMAANPFGREKSRFPGVKGQSELVRLGMGERIRFRYGILLHAGDANSGNVAEHYQRFVKLRDQE
jgi:hypothetical protein